MEFTPPLIRATLLRRYKRFLADVILEDGQHVTAHCANPGAMTGLAIEGATVWLQTNTNPKRKLRHSWKLVESCKGLVCVDTGLANDIVAEGLQTRAVPTLDAYPTFRREVKYGESSRIDFLLSAENRPDCYLEVKSVSLCRQQGLAEFPDSVTMRGTKHLQELASMVDAGHRAVMLYLVQHSGCSRFALAADIDPAYAAAFHVARAAGVETICHVANISSAGITLGAELPLDI